MLYLLDKHAIPFVSVECDASPLRGSSAGSHRVHCSYPHSPSHQTPCDSSQMCLVDWVCGILDIGCFSRKTGRRCMLCINANTMHYFFSVLASSQHFSVPPMHHSSLLQHNTCFLSSRLGRLSSFRSGERSMPHSYTDHRIRSR